MTEEQEDEILNEMADEVTRQGNLAIPWEQIKAELQLDDSGLSLTPERIGATMHGRR